MAGLAVGVTLLVAGCTDGSSPKPSPLPSASVSSSSGAPAPSAPAMPAEAKGTSAASAKAFVRYYIGAVNFALETGDVSEVRQLSDAGCSSCSAVADSVSAVYENGDRLTGKGWEVKGVSPVANQPRLRPVIQVAVLINPQTKISGSNAKPEHRPGGHKLMVFDLASRDGQWIVAEWEQTT